MQPSFKQIWDEDSWLEYKSIFKPHYTHRYYMLRSLVRMAIWMPMVAYAYYLVMASI